MISLSGLNPPQRLACEIIDGPLLILAGAGSGKTRTITYRIAHMVDNLKISPKNILGISFTNKAASEMRERVKTLLKKKSQGITLCTFHSLGLHILKKEITHLGYSSQFTIYDQSDQMAIIRDALKNYNAEKNFDKTIIASKISRLKNNGMTPEDFASSSYFHPDDAEDIAVEYCYRFYQDKLKFFNAIDFDDILLLTVKLFKNHPEIAASYSKIFKYIMIDEYQDTNALQFHLVLALTLTHSNLCVVGDDDQSIYAFRGADITNILQFEKHFKNAQIIKLEENYRSTNPILKLANNVIKKSKSRRDKTLWSNKESEIIPYLWSTGDSDHEASEVISEIVRYQSEGGHLGDIAVLYRSNTQAPLFEEQLKMCDVPYLLYGGQKFYEKKEIKDLMAYLAVIHNPSDEISLRRILNVPHRGIGTATLEKYAQYSRENNNSLFYSLKNNPHLAEGRQIPITDFVTLILRFQKIFQDKILPEALSHLIEEIKYLDFIKEEHHKNPKQAERRQQDIMFFMESAKRFSDIRKEHATLASFVEKLILQDNQDTQNENEDKDIRQNRVSLMTLHSAKGLEFEIVYLVGMEEELLPHKRAVKEGNDLDEERRLAYVGITRAKDQLIMTYCKKRKIYGKDIPRHPSRFLMEARGEMLFIEQDRNSFGHLAPDQIEAYKKNFFLDLLEQDV